VTDGLVVGMDWLEARTEVVDDATVLEVNDNSYTVPEADLVA
jgi:hypothetical protein